jgi:hypothetical protein
MPAATRGVVTVTLWSRDDLDATDAAPTCDVVQEYDTRDGVWTVARGILRQYGIPDHVSGTADDGVAEATAWLEPHAGPDGTGRVEQWLEIRGPEAFVDAVVARLLTARDVRELV